MCYWTQVQSHMSKQSFSVSWHFNLAAKSFEIKEYNLFLAQPVRQAVVIHVLLLCDGQDLHVPPSQFSRENM